MVEIAGENLMGSRKRVQCCFNRLALARDRPPPPPPRGFDEVVARWIETWVRPAIARCETLRVLPRRVPETPNTLSRVEPRNCRLLAPQAHKPALTTPRSNTCHAPHADSMFLPENTLYVRPSEPKARPRLEYTSAAHSSPRTRVPALSSQQRPSRRIDESRSFV